jgi:hypothetical protein
VLSEITAVFSEKTVVFSGHHRGVLMRSPRCSIRSPLCSPREQQCSPG